MVEIFFVVAEGKKTGGNFENKEKQRKGKWGFEVPRSWWWWFSFVLLWVFRGPSSLGFFLFGLVLRRSLVKVEVGNLFGLLRSYVGVFFLARI